MTLVRPYFEDKIVFVIWNDDRRAWVAAEGTGMFYTSDPDKARQFPSQEEAQQWAKLDSGETIQRWIGG